MPCQLVTAVSGALAAAYRQHGAAPPATIIDTVTPLAPLIAASAPVRLAMMEDALAELTKQPTLDTTCCCAIAALLHASSAVESDRELGRQLCARLWDALASHQSSPAELECASHCVARVFPTYGGMIVDAAVESLTQPGDSAAMPRAAAVEVLGCIATAIVANIDGDWCAHQSQRLVDAALTCVSIPHESGTTVPAVTRRILIPLMRNANVMAETRLRAIELVHGFQRKGQLAEAIVLIAALFDLLFPMPASAVSSSSKATAGKGKQAAAHQQPIVVPNDLRHESFVWDVLLTSLESSGSRVDALGGPIKVAGLHLQAIYLLKRLVSYTKDVDGLASTLSAAYHSSFVWRGKDSDKAWEQFFLVFDCLTEYGLHIVNPALDRVAGLVTTATTTGAIGMAWVETLVDKAINHPNVGARKLGLGVLWSTPIDVVVQHFSLRLVCDTAYVAACDPKLCSEADKVAMPGTFLDCKAFNGKPCHDLPQLQPVSERFEKFNISFIRATTAAERRDRALRMIQTALQGHVSRFGVCLTCRFVRRLSDAVDLRGDVASPALLSALHTLVVTEVQDKLSFWLEARLDAILLDTIINFATLDVARSAEFVALIAQLTTAGATGGASLSAVDVCGVVGSIGSAFPHASMMKRLLDAAQVNPAIGEAIAAAQLTPTLVERTVQQCVVAPAVVKQTVCLLDQTASATGLDALTTCVVQLSQQTAMNPRRKVATLLLFTEVAVVLPSWLSAPREEALLSSIVDTVLRIAVPELAACASSRLTETSTTQLRDDDWFVMQSDNFDVLSAALYQSLKRLKSHTWRSVELPFQQLLQLATNSAPATTPSCEYARMMVVRNALRLMHTCLMAAVDDGCQHSLADWVARFSPSGLETMIGQLMKLPALHLTAADVPSPLTGATGWGGCVAQCGRYVADCVATLLHALPKQGPSTLDIQAVGAYSCDMLDECSQCNLSAAFDIACWAARRGAAHPTKVASWLRIMRQRLEDEHIRREGHRCCSLLGYTLVQVGAEVRETVDEIITGVLDDDEANDRLLYSLGTGMSAAVLNDASVFCRFEDHLIHLAVITNTYGHDDEMDAWLAVTEPVISDGHWEALKAARPSSNGAAAVARCAAICAILHHALTSDKSERVRLVLKLLDLSNSHPALTKNPCMPDSPVHRCRIRVWQLLVAFVPLLDGIDVWRPVTERLVNEALETINMGSVRRYIEFMTMAALNACPDLYVLIADRLRDVDLRAQVCGSHALIALHLLKRHGATHEAMRRVLVPIMVRLCASHFHILRLTCQIGLHDLGTDPSFSPFLSPDAMAIVELVEHNADAKKFRERHLDVVVFDEDLAMKPVAVFCTQRKEGDNWLHDSVPPSAFDRVSFAHAELTCLLGANSPIERFRCRVMLEDAVAPALTTLRQLTLVPHSCGPEDDYMRYPAELWAAPDGPVKDKNAGNSESDNLQRKVTSWWNSEVHSELHPRALGTRARQQLVIVATLLDYPVNIAGLCRCAEIFAIEKVVVADRKIFTNPQFVAVARSAELWMPWEEVPPGALATYLDGMRRLGYTIVGVEQTANSVPLQTYDFPQRTVVVLGAEGTGIPANYLPCLDVCLEIPQFGLIRSLNVHVTGAVAMYEFTRQHLMEGTAAAAE